MFSTPVMGLLGVVILGVGSLEFGFWVVGVVFSWCVSTSPLEDPIVLRNLASDARASGGSLPPPPPPPVPKGGGGRTTTPPPPTKNRHQGGGVGRTTTPPPPSNRLPHARADDHCRCSLFSTKRNRTHRSRTHLHTPTGTLHHRKPNPTPHPTPPQ